MSNQLTITVDVAEGYEPSPALRKALAAIDAALQADHPAETAGFAAAPYEEISFVFHTITWSVVGNTVTTHVVDRDTATGQASGVRR